MGRPAVAPRPPHGPGVTSRCRAGGAAAVGGAPFAPMALTEGPVTGRLAATGFTGLGILARGVDGSSDGPGRSLVQHPSKAPSLGSFATSASSCSIRALNAARSPRRAASASFSPSACI